MEKQYIIPRDGEVLVQARRLALLVFAASVFALRAVIGIPVPTEEYLVIGVWYLSTFSIGPLVYGTGKQGADLRLFAYMAWETVLALAAAYFVGNLSWVGIMVVALLPLLAGLSLRRQAAYLIALLATGGMLLLANLEASGYLQHLAVFGADGWNNPRFVSATGLVALLAYLTIADISWRFADILRLDLASEKQWHRRLQEADRHLAKYERQLVNRDEQLVSEAAHRTEALLERNLELSILNSLSLSLGQSLELDIILSEVVNSVSKMAGAARVELSILNDPSRNISSSSRDHAISEVVRGKEASYLSEPFLKTVAASKRLVIADLARGTAAPLPDGSKVEQSNSLLLVPIISKNTVLGVIGVAPGAGNTLTLRDVGLLRAVGAMLGNSLENSLLYARIKKISDTDSLTGLYNQGYMRRQVIDEVKRSARYKQDVSVMMIDMDDFKLINDSYGHLAGDQALNRVARAILSACRTTDVVGRYGGDEYLVILTQTDIEAASTVAGRIIDRVSQVGVIDTAREGVKVGLGVSIGLACMPRHAKNSTELLAAADACLYAAKAKGGNQVVSALGRTALKLAGTG